MENEWLTKEAFWDFCRRNPIDPILRILLTSDGTLIGHLRSLSLAPVEVAVQEQREISIDAEQASWIGVPAGEKGIQRKVWLTVRTSSAPSSSEIFGPLKPAGKERKIYAVSTFPLSGLKPELYQEIQLGHHPIGQMIETHRLLTRRDRLEIARLALPPIAEELGLKQEELFWARRYRLILSDQVSAVIFEAFSPSLFSS